MKLPFNPFKLRRQVAYYAALCKKQCIALRNANDHLAELVDETCQQKKQIKFLETELKIAQDRLKAEQMLWEMAQPKK